jgi:hypothetical protein
MDLDLLLIKLLAVAGGAALGAGAIGAAIRILAKRLGNRKVPGPVNLLLRGLAAMAVALGVWLWVFGLGGPGWLRGGGGSLFGRMGGQGDGAGPRAPAGRTEKQADPTAAAQKDSLRVIMLGGKRVADGRFYVLEGGNAQDLRGTKQLVKERQRNSGVKGIEIIIYENSVARGHPAVRDLEDWAKQNDLQVSLSAVPGEAP